MPDQPEIPRIEIENAVSITGAALYQHQHGIYELVVSGKTRTYDLRLYGHSTQILQPDNRSVVHAPHYEFMFTDEEIEYPENSPFETVKVFIKGEYWTSTLYNKDQRHIWMIPRDLTSASKPVASVDVNPSAVPHQENTDAFRVPSSETRMSSIGDNSKTPYIDHVKKTRARQ